MTSNAVTSQAAHATLEDLGYQNCKKHGGVYWWLGEIPCPKCKPAGEKRHPKPRVEPEVLPKKERAKGICNHYLSSGNPGPLCRPCVVTWRREHPNSELPKRKEDLQNAKSKEQINRQRYAARKLKQGHIVPPRADRVRLPNLWVHLNKASRRGMGREEVAKKVGISTNSLYAYAQPNTTRTCALDKAHRLANLLGVSLEELQEESSVDDSLTRQYHLHFYLPNLNFFRKEQGLTWPQVAERTGLPQSSIQDYVKAHRCSPQKAKQIADALGVTVEELRGEG